MCAPIVFLSLQIFFYRLNEGDPTRFNSLDFRRYDLRKGSVRSTQKSIWYTDLKKYNK